MAIIDEARLEPGEIGFHLDFNGYLEPRLLIDFLELLTRSIPSDILPAHKFQIVELATGSLWGRIRILLDKGAPLDVEALKQVEAGNARNRAILIDQQLTLDRIADTLDRMAQPDAARDAREREAQILNRWALGVAAAGLIFMIVTEVRRNENDPAARIISEIMDDGGVSTIILRTADTRVVLGRDDVPAYTQRRADRISASVGADIGEIGTLPPGWARPLRTDLEPKVDREDAADRDLPPNAMGHWVDFAGLGTIVRRDRTVFFRPYQNPDDKLLLVIAPDKMELDDGAWLMVHGEAFIGSGRDVLVIRTAAPEGSQD